MPTIRHRQATTDTVDERILALLQADARMTMADLGRRVGLSRTAALARVRRMEADGVIRGYHADVAVEPEEAHVARVGVVLTTSDTSSYVRRLLALDEVSEAETVAGEFDLLLRLSAPTARRLDEVLDRINGWRETVRTTTFVVLRRYP
ncbi:MAG TPA: Lrp/AsnC family transcriptional regulator [Egibacteraceae bacterium]|nr:Lrp/AsnC family transcriptional regulator [Egibacteraceae bacterium]